MRACYGILDADEQGYSITLHRVAYDMDALMRTIDAMYFPNPEFLRVFYRGDYIPTWEREQLWPCSKFGNLRITIV